MSKVKIAMARLDDVAFHPHNIRVNLGDLRSLTDSIKRFGVMQPIVVEQYGNKLRLRAGHRRTTAARLAGLKRVPAVVHAEALDLEEWIAQSIHENVERRELDRADKRRAVEALRKLGCTWSGIAETFGVSETTVKAWLSDTEPGDSRTSHIPTGRGPSARTRAINSLIEAHQQEFQELLARESEADVDWVIIERAMDGQVVQATRAERLAIINRWRNAGRSMAELDRIQGWNVMRDLRGAA